jgi:hypothetical protein
LNKTYFNYDFFLIGKLCYSPSVQNIPSKPLLHPSLHIPSTLSHCSGSKQCPHCLLQLLPYAPSSHSRSAKTNKCTESYITITQNGKHYLKKENQWEILFGKKMLSQLSINVFVSSRLSFEKSSHAKHFLVCTINLVDIHTINK